MAKDDFFVIAFRILAYLYACMKEGGKPDLNAVSSQTCCSFALAGLFWAMTPGSTPSCVLGGNLAAATTPSRFAKPRQERPSVCGTAKPNPAPQSWIFG